MRKLLFILSLFFFPLLIMAQNDSAVKEKINKTLDDWHQAAAEADFEQYFSFMSEDAIYIGTDATENWSLQEFKSFSEPYFNRGKAWSFTPLERHIYLSEDPDLAWFDELLDTQMGICRGSGVIQRINRSWKIKHYVLSISIPNENVSEVVELKKDFDQQIVQQLKLGK